MKDKLEQLYQYLLNNNYFTEAKTIKIILDEGLSNNTVSKIKGMCTPRYLGDLYIQEFDDAYKWWNFLGDVSMEIEVYFDGDKKKK